MNYGCQCTPYCLAAVSPCSRNKIGSASGSWKVKHMRPGWSRSAIASKNEEAASKLKKATSETPLIVINRQHPCRTCSRASRQAFKDNCTTPEIHGGQSSQRIGGQ